jgi:hypothetical protein
MGRITTKLGLLLESIGFRDVRLFPARGYWRTDHRSHAYRWEGVGENLLGLPVNFGSYDTMTACARGGVVLDRESNRGGFFEVSAKEIA